MKIQRIFLVGLVVFTLLSSCSLRPSQLLNQSTPTFPLIDINTPTFSKEPTITPVASTTRRATFAPIVTSTRGPSITPFPSFTPIPEELLERIQGDVTKARFMNGLGGTGYQCKILSTEPEELEVLRPKEEFAGIWRIENRGKSQWTTTDMAYFYISGWRFQTQKYKEDFIPYVVNPKEELHLHVPMRAPAEEGVYFAIWGLRIKSLKQFFCTFSLSITVQAKR